ncbi:hypothetical protein DFR29_1366 [Tahibacter aquaticus]|uniref:Uncharacterized protein n=1 Tax=Tahibacter aquaticus TaxID=520092 RepID=A0A4R6YFY6_9GAMM|nr:hypothetical protein [Tahibacter aquaticus]TDR35355.1 hypothetical protein DFR29_1366 [Tahibacter aquaticus]
MNTTIFPTTFAFVLTALLLVAANFAAAAEPQATLRPERVRGFVIENATTVLVREGRESIRRIVLDGPCASLATTARVDFQIGGAVLSSDEAGRDVSVVLKNAPPVVSTGTPHLNLVAAQGDARTACRVARIEAATSADFDSAGRPGDVRDQRRDAAGR